MIAVPFMLYFASPTLTPSTRIAAFNFTEGFAGRPVDVFLCPEVPARNSQWPPISCKAYARIRILSQTGLKREESTSISPAGAARIHFLFTGQLSIAFRLCYAPSFAV